MRSAKGFSLIELLVALTLSIPLLAASLFVLRQLASSKNVLAQYQDRSVAILKTERYLQKIVNDLDSHRLNIPPRITGAQITGINLASESSFEVKSCTMDGTNFTIRMCLRHVRAFEAGAFKGFIGIGPQGFEELQGLVRGHGVCRTAKLHAEESAVLGDSADTLGCTVQVLVPIREEYSVLIDDLAELRYVGHQGNKIIENQPVVAGLQGMQVSTTVDPLYNLTRLEASVTAEDGSTVSFIATNTLARLAPYNFMLNP